MYELKASTLNEIYMEQVQPPPSITPQNEVYWRSLEEGKLVLQRCDDCQKLRSPISPLCPFCSSLEYTWTELSGRGTLWTHATVYRKTLPGFDLDPPYAIVVVELDEGPRIASNLIDYEARHLRVGQPVEVRFVRLESGPTLARFAPVD